MNQLKTDRKRKNKVCLRAGNLRKQFPGLLRGAAEAISDVYDWMVKV